MSRVEIKTTEIVYQNANGRESNMIRMEIIELDKLTSLGEFYVDKKAHHQGQSSSKPKSSGE